MMKRIRSEGWHMIDEIDLVAMIADHADLELLCDRLEDVAVALPRLPSPSMALELCGELDHKPPTHEARERALLRMLFGSDPMASSQAVALQHIHHRSGAHVVLPQDRAGALQPDGVSIPANTLGYMLRSFFEGCRAAMAFEELAILHFGRDRLTPGARVLLEDSLEARCRT